MVFSNEIMLKIKIYSANCNSEKIYSGDVPKDVLDEIKEINKTYKKVYGENFIKIVSGNEMVNGKPVSIKKLGEAYLCYVDRTDKEKIEELKKYNEKMKKETGFNFVTFIKG